MHLVLNVGLLFFECKSPSSALFRTLTLSWFTKFQGLVNLLKQWPVAAKFVVNILEMMVMRISIIH